MTAKLFRSVPVLALTATLALALPGRAAVPPAEKLLPADTLAVLSIPDFNALRAASLQSPQMLCWNSAVMQPFRDSLTQKVLGQFAGPLEQELGMKLADFTSLPQGQLTFAVTLNGWDGGNDSTPGIILLLDAGQQSGLLQTNLAKLTQKLQDEGKGIRTETLHGIRFSVLPLGSNGLPNSVAGMVPPPQPVQDEGKPVVTPKAGEIVFGQFGTLLVAGNSLKAVEPVAARLTGGGVTPLAENPLFAADQTAQFRNGPIYYGWFNGKTLFETLAAHAPTTDPDAPSAVPSMDVRAALKSSGLAGMKSASFAIYESAEGERGVFHVTAPGSERAGLLKMFAFNSKEAGVPVFVPADAVKFYRVRLDMRQLWAELQKVVAGISPQALASLNSVIDLANTMAQSKNPGFDLRTALIGNLGDDLISYEKAPADSSAAALANPPSLFLLAAANPDQTIDALKTVAAMAASQSGATAPRDFLGHQIHTIALRGGVDPATGQPKTAQMYVTASGGYVAFSDNAGMIEEYLRSWTGNGKALRDLPGLADAAQQVGGTGGGLFGYTNQREVFRLMFQLFKNSAASPTPVAPGVPFDIRSWADFSLLPDYDMVSKYFGISVLGGNVNSSGVTIKMYSPRPPQAR